MSFPWANHYEPKNPLMQWIDSRLPLPRLVGGKIVTKKKRPPKHEAGAAQAAKKGARTRKTGAAVTV